MRTVHANVLAGNAVRFRIEPRLVPPLKAARYLHLTPQQFQDALPALIDRGFPPPCPVVGHFDLTAIDLWIDRQSGIGAGEINDCGSVEIERMVLERIEKYGSSNLQM